jgi:uncharacterized protein YbbK (DUF523 family)
MRVGVSSCLLGENVRYDGGHKRNDLLIERLKDVEWITVCPEVEMGLSIPRPPMHVEDGHLMVTDTGEDLTERMHRFSEQRIRELADLKLAGYVFKSKSPSCGLKDGLFATALMEAFPDLPVTEESRLDNPDTLESFVARVCAYQERLDLEGER